MLALAACATPDASKAELLELKAELRAMREENARLGRRLDRLETLDAVAAIPKKAAPVELKPAAEVPSLTVVKLKPRADPAPKVDTRVAVVEPAPAILDELAAAAPQMDREETPDPSLGEVEFEAGLTALKTGNVVGGVERLQRFAAENPKHPKADNALYFSGIGLMGLNDYEDAAAMFQQVVGTYPAGDAVVDGLLKLAECRVRLNQPKDARAIYQKVVASYPGTSAATLAEARLGSLGQGAATGSP